MKIKVKLEYWKHLKTITPTTVLMCGGGGEQRQGRPVTR